MSLDAEIRAIVAGAVLDAARRASASKEVMNAEEAREFLGYKKDQWKKRWRLIPKRQESERSYLYLRDDLLEYLRSLPRVPDLKSDYPPDYVPHPRAPYSPGPRRFSA